MDAYFRQTWVDQRLRFSGTTEMAVHIKMLQKIWKPDTYFLNGRDSYLHTITEPNKLLRINPNGTILYSMRLPSILSSPGNLTGIYNLSAYCALEQLLKSQYSMSVSRCMHKQIFAALLRCNDGALVSELIGIAKSCEYVHA
jgi:Neurotransmitter-gated ion-channel ligand binding domain